MPFLYISYNYLFISILCNVLYQKPVNIIVSLSSAMNCYSKLIKPKEELLGIMNYIHLVRSTGYTGTQSTIGLCRTELLTSRIWWYLLVNIRIEMSQRIFSLCPLGKLLENCSAVVWVTKPHTSGTRSDCERAKTRTKLYIYNLIAIILYSIVISTLVKTLTRAEMRREPSVNL
jgi:hypothetical protein